MESTNSPKAKPDTSGLPLQLTPSEQESLRQEMRDDLAKIQSVYRARELDKQGPLVSRVQRQHQDQQD